MRTVRAWLHRVAGMFGRSRRERELADEIENHLQLDIAANLRAGMNPAEARRQALLKFGPVEAIKETYRDRRGIPALENLARDLRLATRSLRQSPGFATAVVLTLGLGIAAVTAVFGLAYGVVFSPLPYPDSDALVALRHTAPGLGIDLGMPRGFYTAYRERSTTLDEVGIFRYRQRTLAGGAHEPEVVRVAEATASLFGVLRAKPLVGRLLEPGDDAAGTGRVAVIGHSLWQRRYAGDRDIVGETVSLDGQPTTVVGVLPPDFVSPELDTDVWVDGSTFDFASFGSFNAHAIGRVRPGFTLQDVGRDLNALIDSVKEAMPEAAPLLEGGRVAAVPRGLKEHIVGDVERAFWVLMGSVALVLTIACANVANLLLVRADSRSREAAVRRALGASRLQVARYVLAESAVLAVLGGAIGIGLAVLGMRALVRWTPVDIPRLNAVGATPVVLLFAFALTAALTAVLALTPLLERTARAGSALRNHGRTMTAGRTRMRVRRAIVVTQVALALVLIVSAGLLARSFWRLTIVEPGFDPTGLLTFELSLPHAHYPTVRDAADFHVALLEQIEALPGVTAVAATRRLPLRGLSGGNSFSEEGHPLEPGTVPPNAWLNRATAGYFETLRIPLLRGRALNRADLEQRTNAIVINETFAELYWPDDDPLGKRVSNLTTGGDPVWLTIVGVVGDTKAERLEEAPQPMAWASPLAFHYDEVYALSYAVRAAVPPLSLADDVQRLVRAADPGLAVVRLATGQSIVDTARAPMAFTMILLLIAAAAGLALGAIGAYGVAAYAVRQRVAEIGIRMAFGACGGDVRRRLLVDSVRLGALGATLGLLASFSVSRVTESLLYSVDPLDPVVHAGATTLLLIVVLLATWIPSLTASRVAPATALRS